MIHTRFGNPVKILGNLSEEGFLEVEICGQKRTVHISELRAEGGINEIMKVIKEEK